MHNHIDPFSIRNIFHLCPVNFWLLPTEYAFCDLACSKIEKQALTSPEEPFIVKNNDGSEFNLSSIDFPCHEKCDKDVSKEFCVKVIASYTGPRCYSDLSDKYPNL